jgi:hypothetical protein
MFPPQLRIRLRLAAMIFDWEIRGGIPIAIRDAG